jgi:hypothetical protein
MEANEYQIGGEHYKTKYEHWDFVHDCDLHYVIGCATKYIQRWRNKGGGTDLSKAIHYIQKAQELEIESVHFGYVPVFHSHGKREYKKHQLVRFLNTIEHSDDKKIIYNIVYGKYQEASLLIYNLIVEFEKSQNKEQMK